MAHQRISTFVVLICQHHECAQWLCSMRKCYILLSGAATIDFSACRRHSAAKCRAMKQTTLSFAKKVAPAPAVAAAVAEQDPIVVSEDEEVIIV